MTSTYYQIQYRKKADSVPKWYKKCNCRTELEAKRFLDILSQVSNIYSELKIEIVNVETEGGKIK